MVHPPWYYVGFGRLTLYLKVEPLALFNLHQYTGAAGGATMLQDNLKRLRAKNGISQDELAIRLNVVRQTVSKWENGLSVPDADMLIKIADVFDVSVSDLLGMRIENEDDKNELASQLMRINEQLAIKNRRSRRIWKVIAVALVVIAVLAIVISVMNYVPA
jgi:putative transcriptional regulator